MNSAIAPTPIDPVNAAVVNCILVVDDQPANIQLVGAVLGRLGYEIISATDGPTALKRLSLRPVDLILLDLLMPEMDGCEVCRQVRSNPAWQDIPVIFLSAADDKDLIVRALESGGVDYVTKPFNQAELISRVRTQLALKCAGDRLRQFAEDKDELLGILAHDLKNHLGGMWMSAQLLRDRAKRRDNGDYHASQLAENIAHSSGQLLAFVKEYLANAAADYRMTLKPTFISLADAATKAIHQYQEAAQRKQIKIEVRLTTEGSGVWADASVVAQVIENLLSNALKFSPPGKEIHVSVTSNSTHAECHIQDQGPGFTTDDRAQMFQRYIRLSARPTGGEPSTGLGLSIVHKLVQAIHGELICNSAPGAGATFIVRLAKSPAT